jgi:hypothetical protein
MPETVVAMEKGRETEKRSQPLVLEALQATIQRYSWQAAVVRLMSVAVAGWFFTSLPGRGIVMARPIDTVWPVLCLFLLWLWEGHLKSMQVRYCEIYEGASQDIPVHMTLPIPRGFNVSGLWIPMVILHYALLIGLCALVILRF